MKKILGLAILCASFFPFCWLYQEDGTHSFSTVLEQGPYAVGFRTHHPYDFSRTFLPKRDQAGQRTDREIARPVPLWIWYPCQNGAHEHMKMADYLLSCDPTGKRFLTYTQSKSEKPLPPQRWQDVLNQNMLALKKAQPNADRFPLLLYAPGNPGEAIENFRLFEYLASHGYVVAAISVQGDHSKRMQNTLAGIEAQTRDLEFALSVMHFFTNVDRTRTGAMGFSWGGLTAMSLGMRNRQFDALVSMDGAITMGKWFELFQKTNDYRPRAFQIPVMFMVGEPLNGQKADTRFFHGLTYSDALFLEMPGLGHSHFRSLANQLYAAAENRRFLQQKDHIQLQYAQMCLAIRLFFDAHVKGNETQKPLADSIRAIDTGGNTLKLLYSRDAQPKPPMDSVFFDLVEGKGASAARSLFEQTRREDPAIILFEEGEMNGFGYDYLESGDIEAAITLFEMNCTAYPQSVNVYDSLADAYLKKGEMASALACYRKILELDPQNEGAKVKLKQLEKK